MSDRLPPGRFLDATVAEMIMGWSWMSDTSASPVLVPPGYKGGACMMTPLDEKGSLCAHSSLPNFSTNLGDAWEAQLCVDKTARGRSVGTVFVHWFQEQAIDLTCCSSQEVAYLVCLALLEGMTHPAGSLIGLSLKPLEALREDNMSVE